MGSWIKAATRSEVPEGEGIAIQIGDERIALFQHTGRFFAVTDVCPHAGGQLSGGWIYKGRITCPWHGWQFELEPAEDAQDDGLYRYQVRVEGDDVFIELPG